jgi:uncharacterized protein
LWNGAAPFPNYGYPVAVTCGNLGSGSQASNLHADFFMVFLRASDWQKRCFDQLKRAYIDARYKRDYAITKEELEYLSSRERKQQELTKRICEEKITSIA